MGRFINVDAFTSTGQGLLGNNMFIYCNNNPIIFEDASGLALRPCTTVINDGARAEELPGYPTLETVALAFAAEHYHYTATYKKEVGAIIYEVPYSDRTYYNVSVKSSSI